MSFYKDKLEKYSKIKITPEILENTRRRIIFAMQQKYDKAVEELKWEESLSRRTFYNGFSILSDEAVELCKHYEREIPLVSIMNTEDFYNYYKNREVMGIVKVQDKKREKKHEVHENLTKYRQKKGVSGKVSAFLGTDKHKIEKYQTLYNEISKDMNNVDDALDEFKALSDEDILRYLVGRFEVDKKCEFDAKEFEEYMKNLLEQQKGGAEPSNS